MMRGVLFLVFTLLFLLQMVMAGAGQGRGGGGRGRGRGRGFGPRPGRGPNKFGLISNFYATKSCPQAEDLVRQVTWENVRNGPTLGAKLLRIHYHDCFVRGCDASILLDTMGTTKSEKDAPPNLSLGGFEVIDAIKARVEEECPDTVSCADILALAARDAVSFPFKRPLWNVLTGRKDGKVSLISDVAGNLPSPFSNFSTLMAIFSEKGLDVFDLAALSGAHTIGVAHCGAFSRRFFNFTGKGDADPSLDPNYASFLRTRCTNRADRNITIDMDPGSALSFDTHYFTALNRGQGLFQSDAALLTDPEAARLVNQFDQFPATFLKQFGESTMNMGKIGVVTGDDNVAGEVRKNCRVVN